MVWSVKYRRRVLTPEVEKDLKEILYKTASVPEDVIRKYIEHQEKAY